MRIILGLLLFCNNIFPSAITYELNGQRFGDNLSCYSKAKWYSYKYNLPLYFVPFEYSDQLHCHHQESFYSPELLTQFDAVIRVNSESDIQKHIQNQNVLFISNFYSHTPGLYEYCFQDQRFNQIIKNALAPIIPHRIENETNTTTVALHVRKGGGFDKPLASQQIYKKYQYADQQWPTKFPPDQFYLDQIQTLKKLVGNQKKLLIYLFTDDPNPKEIVQRYTEYLNDPAISFTYRKDNSHDTNVVEDFYMMAQCNCLIRSTSLLAKAAQLIGNHQIIMYPIVGTWVDDKIIINPAGIIIRN